MRLAKIGVKGLFSLFSYEIPLFLDEHITIIHGPNGCGKTTILKLVHALFQKRLGEIAATRFDELQVVLDDGRELRVGRSLKEPVQGPQKPRRAKREQWALVFSLTADGVAEHWTWLRGPAERQFPPELIEAHLPFLARIDEFIWQDVRTDEVLQFDDLILRFREQLPFLGRLPGQDIPGWLREILDPIQVNFIQTQRLLRLATAHPHAGDRKGSHRAMVLEDSEQMIGQIQRNLARSVQQSQELDRSFPIRVLTARPSIQVTSDQIREKYQQQQDKQKRLTAAGLIAPQSEVSLPEKELSEVERQMLWLYLEDTDKRLGVFDEFLQKVEVFKEMINSRFQFKTLKIDRERGFVFTGRDDKPIPLNALSSGEQHELVLAYQLLFGVQPGSLILVDEPELSLHVGWQHRFLEDLKRISELAHLDFLVATHSPQIIHKRWDLAVALAEEH